MMPINQHNWPHVIMTGFHRCMPAMEIELALPNAHAEIERRRVSLGYGKILSITIQPQYLDDLSGSDASRDVFVIEYEVTCELRVPHRG